MNFQYDQIKNDDQIKLKIQNVIDDRNENDRLMLANINYLRRFVQPKIFNSNVNLNLLQKNRRLLETDDAVGVARIYEDFQLQRKLSTCALLFYLSTMHIHRKLNGLTMFKNVYLSNQISTAVWLLYNIKIYNFKVFFGDLYVRKYEQIANNLDKSSQPVPTPELFQIKETKVDVQSQFSLDTNYTVNFYV